MIRVLLADDERLAMRGLKLRLAAYDDIEVAAECSGGREADRRLAEQPVDAAFLDIRMPGLNGVEVARRALMRGSPPHIVFVTAFDRYAVRAFEVSAADYIVKPIDDERLDEAVRRLRSRLDAREAYQDRSRLLCAVRTLAGRKDMSIDEAVEATDPACLQVDDGVTRCRIPLHVIDYVEAAGDYMCVRAGDETYVVRTTLARLCRRLEPAGFVRIHRSTLVNRRRIRSLAPTPNGDAELKLHDGTTLKCSRTFRNSVRHALETPGAPMMAAPR